MGEWYLRWTCSLDCRGVLLTKSLQPSPMFILQINFMLVWFVCVCVCVCVCLSVCVRERERENYDFSCLKSCKNFSFRLYEF